MSEPLRKLENALVAYLTDCGSKTPPSLDDLYPHLLERGIMFAVHVPSVFPRDRYAGPEDFIKRIVQELGLKGAYEFRTEGFYKSHRDFDHFRIVSYIRIREVPAMIGQLKKRLMELQRETRQECLFVSVGETCTFFDCWQDKSPELLLEQKTLAELAEPEKVVHAMAPHDCLIHPPRLVVVRGLSGGGFMTRLKKGIASVACSFGIRPEWIDVGKSRPYAHVRQ